MPDYPRMFNLEPIRDWPGELSTRREISAFKATIATTVGELQTEVTALKGTGVTLAIAITREQLRLDGRMRAGEIARHPGVILSFDTKDRGRMRYANDKFTKWEHNLRGIVKELEALRGITRWVNNGGQQYGGFLAIESAIAVGQSLPFHDAESARAWIDDFLRIEGDYARPSEDAATLIRKAFRITHPDVGGDPENFRLVSEAQRIMEAL